MNRPLNPVPPRAFISYSWEGDDHKKWVFDLASVLQGDGIEIIFDQWHLHPGHNKQHFMEQSISESDFVIVICTEAYAKRANNREGGVGYESMIITSEVAAHVLTTKFIPVLRLGSFATSLPVYIKGCMGVDLSATPYSAEQYEGLIRVLHGEPIQPPPLGRRPNFAKTSKIGSIAVDKPDPATLGDTSRVKSLLIVSGSRIELTPNQLSFSISSEEFLISVPSALRNRLLQVAPNFELREDLSTRWIDRMMADAKAGIPDLKMRIDTAAWEAAEGLIRKAEVGDSVFNAALFNVLRMPTGADKEENSTVTVELYKTDYFTLQTLLTTFRRLKHDREREFDLDSSESRHTFRIFRTGFGLNCTVCAVARDGESGAPPKKMLVFGRRSNRAGKTSSTGTWHVTANEALTQKDVVDQQISLKQLFSRALDEEVGIRPEQIGRTYVFNVFTYLEDFQPGMNALVFCAVDNPDEIFFRIGGSMDGMIEYDSHIAIPFDDESIRQALTRGGWPDSNTGEIVPFSVTADNLLRSVLKRGVQVFTEGL